MRSFTSAPLYAFSTWRLRHKYIASIDCRVLTYRPTCHSNRTCYELLHLSCHGTFQLQNMSAQCTGGIAVSPYTRGGHFITQGWPNKILLYINRLHDRGTQYCGRVFNNSRGLGFNSFPQTCCLGRCL